MSTTIGVEENTVERAVESGRVAVGIARAAEHPGGTKMLKWDDGQWRPLVGIEDPEISNIVGKKAARQADAAAGGRILGNIGLGALVLVLGRLAVGMMSSGAGSSQSIYESYADGYQIWKGKTTVGDLRLSVDCACLRGASEEYLQGLRDGASDARPLR